MVTYYELGKHRKLNEIVMAGTHDAGITGGGSGVQTQVLDIGGQAREGVRFFDIRVAARVRSEKSASGHQIAELRAFHADDKVVMKLDRNVVLRGQRDPVRLTQSKLAGGAFGLELTEMLQQARNFVHSEIGAKEFLILKFDKCTNWGLIAEACEQVLGLALYTGGGNINTKTLKELKGKVIVLFSEKGRREVLQPVRGILTFKNLSSEGATYTPVGYDGLQYYGKGGTSPFNPSNKLQQNIDKQKKLVLGASALQNPEIIGMMYWTTTGLIESIQKRDDGMWEPPNVSKMKALWGQGLGDFVNARITLPAAHGHAAAQQRRSFFPNIVMIDFADAMKCATIRGLNDLAASHLSGVA